jgi:hypothetical protein
MDGYPSPFIVKKVKQLGSMLSRTVFPKGLAFLAVVLLAAGSFHLCLCLSEQCTTETASVELAFCSACCTTDQDSQQDAWSSDCPQCDDLDWTVSTAPAVSPMYSGSILPNLIVIWDSPEVYDLLSKQRPDVLASARVNRVPGPPPEQHSILRI